MIKRTFHKDKTEAFHEQTSLQLNYTDYMIRRYKICHVNIDVSII